MIPKQLKGQNAIEYLVTHGWSILIIAIALAGLFYFGVLNAKTFTPRAPPGECSVYRAAGIGSVQGINLAGVCDGELPEFVSRFTYYGPFVEFGGSNITVPRVNFMPLITNSNGRKITMTGWAYTNIQESTQTTFAYGNFTYGGPPFNAIYFDLNESGYCNTGFFVTLYNTYTCVTDRTAPTYAWEFLAMEYNGTNVIGYAVINSNTYISNAVASPFFIQPHSEVLISTPWNGLIVNVQLYNTSLSANSLHSLYTEGLAGAPINLQNLVGWWPLNGNLNDYSGNNNNAYAYNSADLSGAYTNNYTQP
ncbi:MAG: hypothetical protein ABR981_05590 [Candidatus Micrarchaeaceae archaeon]|jgi:hypothetical protein